jgi:hypothetical protein
MIKLCYITLFLNGLSAIFEQLKNHLKPNGRYMYQPL